MHRRILAAVVLAAVTTSAVHAQVDPAERLNVLFDEYDEWERRHGPEDAMRQGDYRFADRITDQSLVAIDDRHRQRLAFLGRLDAIGVEELSEEDQLSHRLFEIKLRRDVDDHHFRTFLAPLGARFGLHQQIPQMGDRVRFESTLDFENYVKRLDRVPREVGHITARMQLGLEERRVPPAIVMAALPEQLDELTAPGGLDRLLRPLDRMAGIVPPDRAEAIRRHVEQRSVPAIRTALGMLDAFVTDKYIPGCRETIAATEWPDGDAYYAHRLRAMTTTTLSASEIHDIGLFEVARIRGEMMDVIARSDFLDHRPAMAGRDDDTVFAAFLEYLRTDPRFYYDDPEDLLDGYRVICKKVDLQMPKYFKVLPRLSYGVEPIPDFMAPHQTTAYYMGGDIRNAQPGVFFANTYALDQRPKYEMTALALHEAVPGHHHQVAIANELEDVPPFRRNTWFTAYGEGWALYAERLGIEMELYEDPYDDFGRLLYEMWRACRLVVDPGMHALGWSRQQAIDYMLANTALSELNITTEVDRYIAWPGQATGYKIGELKMRELRANAELRLGEQFDLRTFHDVILNSGSIPLDLLEERVNMWINGLRLSELGYD